MTSIISELRDNLENTVEYKKDISEKDFWSSSASLVFRADQFSGSPCFYPVFRFEEYYSWSLLALIVLKGELNLNREAARTAEQANFLYYSGNDTIDVQIERVGRPPALLPGKPLCTSPDEYARSWAKAMQQDITDQEARNPSCVNVILAGGKDSLNLLLLNWKNPTFVVSAEPNTPLVREFVNRNELNIDVLELTDPHEEDVLTREILESACRADLCHYRWGAHLRRISIEHDKKVIFWKGQIADALTTPYWKTLTHPSHGIRTFAHKVYARLDGLFPQFIQKTVADQLLVPNLFETLWHRCAMFQGSHMGVIRALTDCLVLSAYHGPRVSEIWQKVHYVEAVQSDIRPQIGAYLHGAPVWYPTSNPSPLPSAFRKNLCRPDEFYSRLQAEGIEVKE